MVNRGPVHNFTLRYFIFFRCSNRIAKIRMALIRNDRATRTDRQRVRSFSSIWFRKWIEIADENEQVIFIALFNLTANALSPAENSVKSGLWISSGALFLGVPQRWRRRTIVVPDSGTPPSLSVHLVHLATHAFTSLHTIKLEYRRSWGGGGMIVAFS